PASMYRFGGLRGRVGPALSASYAALPIVAVIGAAGLFQWKSWARRTLIAWACGDIAVAFASNLTWFVDYTRSISVAPATRPSLAPSIAFEGWSIFLTWLSGAAFPLIVLAILMQPEM